MDIWPFKVQSGKNNRPVIVAMWEGAEKEFQPEEISAMILMKLKEYAETHLGHKVKDAVITVPAYFDNRQRQATRDAGDIAGLNVLRIVNEPTAAALAYGVDKDGASDRMTLIIDLGGGTFDVTILCMDSGVLEVKATNGDTHLGGEDFDHEVVMFCVEQFKKEMSIDCKDDAKAMRRLKSEVEKNKKVLSSAMSAEINLDALKDGEDFSYNMTRSKFEEINKKHFDKIVPVIEACLKDAGVSKDKIHDVVMVGGSTRIPAVRDILNGFFTNKNLDHKMNPDEAVAAGAAVLAAQVSVNEAAKGGLTEVVLIDVTPLSLGIEMQNGNMSVLIPRNTSVPTSMTKQYTNSHDNQQTIGIKIYQGDKSVKVADCTKIAEFDLGGFGGCNKGQALVEVTFEVDTNGILNVKAHDKRGGQV